MGLSSCENSDADDERPEILDDALKDTTGWINLESATNTPKLTIYINISLQRKYVKTKLLLVNHLKEATVLI